MDMLLLLPAVIMAAVFHPSLSQWPFHHRVVQQTIEKLLFEVYIDIKHAWYYRFSFHSVTKPCHAKQHAVHGTHKKYEIYNNIVRCTDFPQENKMHTSKHHHIYFRKPLL